MDTLLKNITAPSLSSGSYGTDIDAAFANIDKNFKTIGNYDFVKGQQGNSIHIEYVNIRKIVSDPSNSMEVLGNDLYKALTRSIEKFICDYKNISIGGVTATEIIKNSLSSIGEYNWDSWVDDVRVPLIVTENTINETKEYMCSAAVVLFSDARFSSTSLGNNYSKFTSDMIDTTCYINFIRNEYTNEWECQINTNYPRLKFKNNTFYWEVNGSETAIRSTGVQGENGKDGNTFICKYLSRSPEIDFIDDAVLPITEILKSDGTDWDDINNIDIFDGAPVIVHLTYQRPGETDITYWGYITSHIQIKESGGGKSGTVIYLSDTDNKLTWVESASHDVFSTLGTKGLKVNATTPPILDAMPGMFVRMNVGGLDPYYAHCIYSINKTDKDELDEKKTLMISPKSTYLDTLGTNLTGCNLKIEYPTEITTNREIGGIILKDDSSSKLSKIEINNTSGINISAVHNPVTISTIAVGNIDINPADNTNITSDNTNITSTTNTNITSTGYTKITDKKNTITCGKNGDNIGIKIEATDPISISRTADGVTDKIVFTDHYIYISAQNTGTENYISVCSNKNNSNGYIHLTTKSGGIEMSSQKHMSLNANTENVVINGKTGVKLRYNGVDKLLVNNTNVTLNEIPLVAPAVTFPFGFFSTLHNGIGTPTGSITPPTVGRTVDIDWDELCKNSYTSTYSSSGYIYGKMSISVNINGQQDAKEGPLTVNIKDVPGASIFILGLRIKNTTTNRQYNKTFSFKINDQVVWSKGVIDSGKEIWKFMCILSIDSSRPSVILGGYDHEF